MKQKCFSVAISILLFILAACGNSTTNEQVEADIIGYVLGKTDESIFVVSKQAHDFSANDGVSEYYDAIWLSNAPKEIEIGKQVKVWYEGPVQESYPMGGTVGKLEVVSGTEHEGANWSEAEVIAKAIEKQSQREHIAVRSVDFDRDSALWKIGFKELPDGDVYQIELSE